MSLQVIITGVLNAEPKKKTSSNGNQYTTTLVRVPTESDYLSCSVVAFGDSGKILAAMNKGDQVAISGTASPNEWEYEGQTRYGLYVVATQVMTPYQKRKKQKSAQDAQESTEDDFGDSLDSI
ncbi:MAG TPA: single-stranded DNA-binding protein [Candidatus Thiothrix moscowensis]|jgi:single-stranded DNA-binding protein|nr:single-stranded DNA-binding protein [Candidatus Thiothrix moscowensis]